MSLHICEVFQPFMRRSKNFRQRGPGQSDKKSSLFFLVLSLFYRSRMVNFKEIYHFFSDPGGGGPTFSRGGGSNCLFRIETHITCDFPGGSGPPVPPLDPHLAYAARTEKGEGM